MAVSETVKSVIELGVLVTAVVGIAIISVIGIAVLTGFKNTGLVDNTTTDLFILGIKVVGTFMEVIVLGIVGKTLIGMFKRTS